VRSNRYTRKMMAGPAVATPEEGSAERVVAQMAMVESAAGVRTRLLAPAAEAAAAARAGR
jgi:hypothetical protein